MISLVSLGRTMTYENWQRQNRWTITGSIKWQNIRVTVQDLGDGDVMVSVLYTS